MDLYWIWLCTVKGIGPVTQKKLLAVFQSPELIYRADREELVNRTGLRVSFIDALMESRSLEKAKKIQNSLVKHDIWLLKMIDKLYLAEVSKLSTTPALLYYRGNLKEDSVGVAIVGSRRCTKYGKQVTSEAASYLAGQGIPVISGMAKGIDGYAHTACLKAGGYTLAFLANGLDICYPPEHQILMEQIIENGAVISPYPPQTRPLKSNFYKRNALMSAWSFKVLVIEAGIKSGALMTAQYAEQQEKAVLAVPNSIYSPESAGTNKLISQGADIYLQPAQLLPEGYAEKMESAPATQANDAGNSKLPETQAAVELSPLERRILDRLKAPQYMEQLVDIFDGNMAALLDALCSMELEGKITISQGKMVSAIIDYY
ncbi:MAG TPA: DNA-protecting protein DprA [Syntrophomonas sp.]|jgi:DNA processing protein|nr:DNA-protecting protein DprA [Syntrophomonas sp.]